MSGVFVETFEPSEQNPSQNKETLSKLLGTDIGFLQLSKPCMLLTRQTRRRFCESYLFRTHVPKGVPHSHVEITSCHQSFQVSIIGLPDVL